jgi:hypothetical protein
MLCPSIPIDKNKKGGRNYDSSKLTDFKKICLISNDDTSKPNQQTDLIELRRGSLLASSLLTIPGFVPTILSPAPAPAPAPTVNTEDLSDDLLGDLNGITFYVIYSKKVNSETGADAAPDYTYINNIYGNNPAPPIPPAPPTPITAFGNSRGEANKKGNADSIGTSTPFVTGTKRPDVVAALNVRLGNTTGSQDHRFTLSDAEGNHRLVASLTDDGKLRLSISRITFVANPDPTKEEIEVLVPRTAVLPGLNEHVGIFFGSADNGSTKLGVTAGARNGVTGGALLIIPGQSSATALFKIGG